MTPSSQLEYVKVKLNNHWELGVDNLDHSGPFDHAHATKVLAAAQTRHHAAYIVPAHPKVTPRREIELQDRAQIGVFLRKLVAHEPTVHYPKGDVRTQDIPSKPDYSLTIDCSQFSTMVCRWAGAPDPNGHGYNAKLGQFTGTFLAHCKPRRIGDLECGDFIVYGPGTGRHMVVVLEPHPTDPLVVSHGQEAGPVIIRHSVEVAFHRSAGRGLVIPEWA